MGLPAFSPACEEARLNTGESRACRKPKHHVERGHQRYPLGSGTLAAQEPGVLPNSAEGQGPRVTHNSEASAGSDRGSWHS